MQQMTSLEILRPILSVTFVLIIKSIIYIWNPLLLNFPEQFSPFCVNIGGELNGKYNNTAGVNTANLLPVSQMYREPEILHERYGNCDVWRSFQILDSLDHFGGYGDMWLIYVCRC